MLDINTVSIARGGEIQQNTKDNENKKRTIDECNRDVAQAPEVTEHAVNIPINDQQSVVPSASS